MLVGIVGKSNVGKSTFFKALTLAEVEIANYPFTTINPNRGFGYVKTKCVDKDFNVKCQPKQGYCLSGWRFAPVELLDVAGLVPGAHEGRGLGNRFLDDLRQAHAFIHIIDASGTTNENGELTQGYDPANDVRFLETELDMWYLQILNNGWERFARQMHLEQSDINKTIAKQLSALNVTESLVKETRLKLELDSDATAWSEHDLKNFAISLRKSTKPMIIAANKIDLPGAKENFERIKKEFPDYIMVACSAESELALREAAKNKLIDYVPGAKDFKIIDESKLSDKQKKALNYIKSNVLNVYGSTGIQQALDAAVFTLLNLIAVYPVENDSKLSDGSGRILPDVYLLPKGSTAFNLAEKVHTDIANRFSCAIDARTKKRLGKDHALKQGDVLKIMTN